MSPRHLLRSFYLYQATASFVFFQPIFFLFYEREIGLSIATVLWLKAYYTALRALFELPFGVLADRWSRRGCLVASALCATGSALVLLLVPSLSAVVLAETLLAAAHALRSGADSALLYDALKASDELAVYPRAESRGRAASALAAGVTAIVGGFLANVDLRLPYVATVLAGLASATVASRLHEASGHSARGVLDRGVTREAIALARREHAIWWAVGLAVLAVVVSHVYFFLQQPYLESVAVPVWMFGVVCAATKLVTAVVASVAHRADARLGQRGTAAVVTLVPTIGLGAMALVTSPIGAVLILSRGLMDGLWEPLVHVYMNRLAPTHLRATLLSLQSLLARLGLAIVIGALAWFTEGLGLQATLGAAAVATFVVGVVLVWTARDG